MSKRNSLLEWIAQTRKLAKENDYAAAKMIDRIRDILPFVDPRMLGRHKEMINDVCVRYNKPDLFKAITDKRARKRFFDGLDRRRKERRKCSQTKGCDHLLDRAIALNQFVDSTLACIEKSFEVVNWQWYEIVDVMYERLELVDPSITKDEYVIERITFVCGKHVKNNPFTDGTFKLFGKFWRDKNGKLRPERRRRF